MFYGRRLETLGIKDAMVLPFVIGIVEDCQLYVTRLQEKTCAEKSYRPVVELVYGSIYVLACFEREISSRNDDLAYYGAQIESSKSSNIYYFKGNLSITSK